jgi:hypothetical protein
MVADQERRAPEEGSLPKNSLVVSKAPSFAPFLASRYPRTQRRTLC